MSVLNWEGPEFYRFLQDFMFGQDMVDFGCGEGRLAPFFSKQRYRGVDISPMAVANAQAANPGYAFNHCVTGEIIEGGYALLAHDVMRYIDPVRMPLVPGTFTQHRVVVSEPMGYRYPAGSEVFFRELEAYERAFRAVKYRLHRVLMKSTDLADDRGKPIEITVLEFHRQKQ